MEKIKRDWHGRIIRRLSLDESYFKQINTPSKAYWLGFLTADGHLTKLGNGVRLDLAFKDKQHILKFKKIIKSGHKLYHYKQGKRNSIVLAISCKKMHQDLKNKLTYYNLAQIKSFLLPHYIRGIFDGDGCLIYLPNRKSKIRISLLGQQSFLNELQQKSPIQKCNKTKNLGKIWEVRVDGQRAVKFLHWIYKFSNKSNRLDRKYDKYQRLMTIYKEKI